MQGTHLYYELHSTTLENGACDVKVGQIERELAQHTAVRSTATSPIPLAAASPLPHPPLPAVGEEVAHLIDCSNHSVAANTALAVGDKVAWGREYQS